MSPADLAWVLLLLVSCLLSIGLSRLFLGHGLTPLSIYICTNLGSLSLYHLRQLDLITLSLETYALALASVALFAIGSLMAVGWRVQRFDTERTGPPDMRGLHVFFYTTTFLACTGWVLASVILIARFGLASLLANLWLLQEEFQMQFIGYLNVLGILVAPVYVIKRIQGTHRRLDIFLVFLTLFGLFLAGIKSYIVFTIIAMGLVWSVLRPHGFKTRHIGVILVTLLTFFVFYTKEIDIFAQRKYEGSTLMTAFPWLQRPYLYAVGSWPALEAVSRGEVPPPPRFGHVILEPLWKILSAMDLTSYYPRYLPFADIGPDGFNVYSFVGEIYWDVGLGPALLLSWLLGLVSMRMYYRARTCPFWAHGMIYGIVGYGVFLSPFAYIYSFKFVVMIVYVYSFGFFMLRRGVLVDRRSRT